MTESAAAIIAAARKTRMPLASLPAGIVPGDEA